MTCTWGFFLPIACAFTSPDMMCLVFWSRTRNLLINLGSWTPKLFVLELEPGLLRWESHRLPVIHTKIMEHGSTELLLFSHCRFTIAKWRVYVPMFLTFKPCLTSSTPSRRRKRLTAITPEFACYLVFSANPAAFLLRTPCIN
jgi:hypothetical protein